MSSQDSETEADSDGETAGFTNVGVVSSCFSSIEYNSSTGELAMTFAKDGRRYLIPNIEAIEVERWINSGSPGGYFNSFIKGAY